MSRVAACSALKHDVADYVAGRCRCAQGKAAWAAYMRARRRRKRAPVRRTRNHIARVAYYSDKQPRVGVQLTRLGQQIISEAERKHGRPVDDLLEQAVRRLGVDGFAFEAVS